MGGSPPPSGRLPGPSGFPGAAAECGPTGWRGRSSQSEFDLLGDAESVIYLDPEITDRTLQLRMAEQQLHGPQIAGLPVNLRRLRLAHRMCAEGRSVETGPLYPLVDDACILACRQMRLPLRTA